MTTAQQLLDEWTAGEQTGLRPKRVQALRDELKRVTGEPVPRRLTDIERVVLSDDRRGVYTRKLKEAVDGADSDDSDADDPADGSDDEDAA